MKEYSLMKKIQEGNKRKGGEEDSSQESSKLLSGATVKSSSVKEKIKVFNVRNSLNVAHVDKTKAHNINVVSASSNSPKRASSPPPSPVTQPSSSVSYTNVGGDLSVSSYMETNQPMATASGNTLSGDLNVKVIKLNFE